jgi:hypothetical protein
MIVFLLFPILSYRPNTVAGSCPKKTSHSFIIL